jgi:hypothetical protein
MHFYGLRQMVGGISVANFLLPTVLCWEQKIGINGKMLSTPLSPNKEAALR